jgi:hypothetical protein
MQHYLATKKYEITSFVGNWKELKIFTLSKIRHSECLIFSSPMRNLDIKRKDKKGRQAAWQEGRGKRRKGREGKGNIKGRLFGGGSSRSMEKKREGEGWREYDQSTVYADMKSIQCNSLTYARMLKKGEFDGRRDKKE